MQIQMDCTALALFKIKVYIIIDNENMHLF